MKRQFECGHSGKGKYCHRCAVAQLAKSKDAELKKILADARNEKENERKRLKAIRRAQGQLDCIDLCVLDHLPVLQDKARDIIEAMSSGASYFDFGGKRLISMKKEVLSIPIGDSYRLIYRVNPLVAVELLSHEDYNNRYVT